MSGSAKGEWPPPNIDASVNGRTVLPAIAKTWGRPAQTRYGTGVEIGDGQHPPAGYAHHFPILKRQNTTITNLTGILRVYSLKLSFREANANDGAAL